MKKLILALLIGLSISACKKENTDIYYLAQVEVVDFDDLRVTYTLMFESIKLEGKSLIFTGNICIQAMVAVENITFANNVKSFKIISKQEQICQQ